MQKIQLLTEKMISGKHVYIKHFLAFLFFPLFSLGQGNTINNPIVMGNYSTAGAYTFTGNKSTSGTGNEYATAASPYFGQPSEDIYYKFTVGGTTQISISTCSSTFDTYIHLLNSDGSPREHNDDNGPLCTGLRASLSTTVPAGTYFIVMEGFGSLNGTILSSTDFVVQARPESVIYDTRNFIKVWETSTPETDPNTLTAKSLKDIKLSVSYFDGLGRQEQTVVKQGSLSAIGNTDLVVPVIYDRFGREIEKYLPYVASTNDGSFKDNAQAAQNNFYVGTSSPVAGQGESTFKGIIEYEASPLARVLKTMAPGNSWAGANRGQINQYLMNTAIDTVRIWTTTNSSTIGQFGAYKSSITSYPPGQLYKNITIDEHNNQVIEFKDKDGMLILKKILDSAAYFDNGNGRNHSNWLCTYYVYDDLEQLRAVIQPKAIEVMQNTGVWSLDQNAVDELCFRYEYDARGRLIMKKIPGAGAVYMVYDARDRLVMVQDAKLNTESKWLVTVYENDLNRPIQSGLLSNSVSFASHTASAYNSIAYPSTISDFELLSETHYDNYTGLPTGLTNTLTNNGYGVYLTASSASPDYAEPITQSNQINGMVAWTRLKVLGTTDQYISLVNIYDSKGRVIQTQSVNVTGGLDVVTNQYNFSNQVLRSHVKHQKSGGSSPLIDLATKNNFDDLGRVGSIEKNINNSGWKSISSFEYDAIGQLKSKKLAPAFNGNTGLETINYDYNIRGWMLGANRNYARTTNSTTSYFGFDLGYDNLTIGSVGSFTAPQYNGNITGTVWKSKGDGEIRKYDFTYDAVNRLTGADFNQYTSGFNKTAGIDFSVSNLNYDANGNILSQNQKGWKINGSNFIDQLSYNYIPNTNKLLNVIDGSNDVNTKMGDFRASSSHMSTLGGIKNAATIDYSYDVNGNLVNDKNKDISSIAYNHLNLPSLISISGKGSIEYVYDAAGGKQKKIVHENYKPDKTTLYLFGTYEEDALQILPQEEGRIRPVRNISNQITGYTYDYFLKDHLGNVRMVLTEEQQQSVYPAATLEGSLATSGSPNAAFIEKDYYSIDSANIVDKSLATGIKDYQNNNGNPPYNNNPNSQATALSQKVYKLEANSNGGVNGLGITLKVMSGDRVDVFGKSYYFQNNSTGTNYNVPVLDILNGLLGTPGSAAAGKGVTGLNLIGNTSIYSAVYDFLTNTNRNNDGTAQVPKAYINWVLFDEQFKYVDGGFRRVGSDTGVKSHAIYDIPVNKNGYLYVYVSNESPVKVFFDNLQVIHTKGVILEETHYYPFGLTMAGISSRAMGKLENKYKFNDGTELANKEFNDGSGLEWYETTYRSYDPQIGRFHQIDPISELIENWTPYAYANNNPILFNDPLGLMSDTAGKVDASVPRLPANATPCADCPTGQMAVPKELATVTVTATKSEGGFWDGVLTGVQIGLDVAGLVPGFGEIADGANALIYLGRGDKLNAGLSLAAMVPLAGIAATGGKLANKAIKTLNITAKARKSADVLKLAERILGKGYKEIEPGVFRSADGLKQFRMTSNSDLIGKKFDGVPHVHIEVYNPGNLNNPAKNYHIPLIDP